MGEIEKETLGQWLERLVTEQVAGGRTVERIRRSPFPDIGSYVCERVTVELGDGEQRVMFLKDYSHSRQSKDQPSERRVRELHVYDDLLARASLGTARSYGTMLDDNGGRFWLLLEFIDSEVVKEIDEHNGRLAVEWLARMQKYFADAGVDLSSCKFLLQHDREYFERKAATAKRDVLRLTPQYAGRMDDLIARYSANIGRMLAPPRSLVHGGYIPWHIFVDRVTNPVRVCVVDWELAARGSILYDLAIFTDDAPGPVRDRLYTAYHDAALSLDLPVPEPPELRITVDCFRLHRVVDWLSRSVEKTNTPEKVDWLLSRAEALSECIAKHRDRRSG